MTKIINTILQKLLHQDLIYHYRQLIKYLITGALCVVIDITTLFILTSYASMYYVFASAIGYSLGATVFYIISVKWVFTFRFYEKQKKLEFLIFLMIEFFALLLLSELLFIITEFCQFDLLVSKLIANLLTAFWNYYAKHIFLFDINQIEPNNQRST